MISREVLRRYPFFAGFDIDQLDTLAELGDDLTVPEGHLFFRENESLGRFYLLLDGTVTLFLEVPDTNVHQSLAGQLTGGLRTAEIAVSAVGAGEIFGSCALVPQHEAAASAKAATGCRVVAFDARALVDRFDTDCLLGYLLTQKAASVLRARLRDLYIETLILQQPGRAG